MSEPLKSLSSRKNIFSLVNESLSFPWEMPSEDLPLHQAFGRRISRDLCSSLDYPPFSRSLRDGYALTSSDLQGVSSSSPAFLTVTGEVPMGAAPEEGGAPGTAIRVFTGGEIPRNFDCVVMEEEVQRVGNIIEIRSSAPSGNHVVSKGEEILRGEPILYRGEQINFTNLGILASAGCARVEIAEIRAGIISTGDEILPVDIQDLPRGCVRDANGWMLQALLKDWGCTCSYYGVLPDDYPCLEECFSKALEENDVVFISGGSSVSTRDFCEKLFRKNLFSPGLLVHGINIKPGKPTLIAGSKDKRKLALGLPGHQHSPDLDEG